MPTCFPKNKNETDWWTQECGSSICYPKIYFSDRYSHFCFSSEPYSYDMGGSKFHHVACNPVVFLPGGKSPVEGINGYAKICRFSSRKLGYIAISPGRGRWGGRRDSII